MLKEFDISFGGLLSRLTLTTKAHIVLTTLIMNILCDELSGVSGTAGNDISNSENVIRLREIEAETEKRK